jgi:polyhydroxyalkanoate synthesis regulator phasin
MIESLKHTLYAGLGAAVLTVEKVEEGLQDLVKRGKLSAEEAREAAERISNESKDEFKEAKKSAESLFEDLLKKARLARQSDVDALLKRIDSLEKEMASMKSGDA